MAEDDSLHLLDAVGVFDDPQLPLRSTDQIQAVNRLISVHHHELPDMDGALEFVVDVVRKVDADYDGFRKHLLKRLKVLDLIQELRTVEDLDQARLILRMAMQLDQVACDTEAIKRDVADTAKAARKRIEADALYSYKEATELVGVSEPTLRRDAKAGNLRKSMIRGAVRFGGNDLLVYLREKKTAIRVLGDGGKGK